MNLKPLGVTSGLLFLAAAASAPQPVSAAAELSASAPAPGAEVSEAPSDLVLSFTQEIAEARIIVNGSELPGEIEEDNVTAPLGSLDDGDYVVEWAVTSEVDDRETSGSFQFRVRAEVESESPPEVDPEARAERVEEVEDENRTEVLLWTVLGIAAVALLALVFFYFRTSIPTFGTTGIQGGLPPPGQSPPEHEDDDEH
ncbi:MAG TPA: copper resistance protein CopC [Dehalococcoidia bacterium]|nr:copper resistance protein CopC [Dehalococcoidia bacterium]